jgi:hypothetical protein
VQDPERSWSNGLGVDDQALQDGPLLAGPLPAGDGVLPGVVVTWLVAQGWRGWRAGGAMGCICGGSRCRGTPAWLILIVGRLVGFRCRWCLTTVWSSPRLRWARCARRIVARGVVGTARCDMGTHDKPPPQPDPSSDGRPPPGHPLPAPLDPGKHKQAGPT